jgi:tyrosine aminotransferase
MSPSGVRTQWQVISSNTAQNTHNPIRDIVENLRLEPNPEKPMIALSIGEFLDTIYIR